MEQRELMQKLNELMSGAFSLSNDTRMLISYVANKDVSDELTAASELLEEVAKRISKARNIAAER